MVLEDIAHDLAGGCRLTKRRGRPSTYHLLLALAEMDEPAPLAPPPLRTDLAQVARQRRSPYM